MQSMSTTIDNIHEKFGQPLIDMETTLYIRGITPYSMKNRHTMNV